MFPLFNSINQLLELLADEIGGSQMFNKTTALTTVFVPGVASRYTRDISSS